MKTPGWRRILRGIISGFVYATLVLLTLWAAAALHFDSSLGWVRQAAAPTYAVAMLGLLILMKRRLAAKVVCLAGFVLVLAWWLMLQPSNDRPWQPDVAQTPWAEIDGNRITIHNVRNCDYRTETDYTPRWETRTVDLAGLNGMDISITYWGSPWIAHPIISFPFANDLPLAFSIETRKEIGESYSAIRGFFRQYELIYVVADERDLLRLRSNFRTDEDVYLYHTNVRPERARAIFLDYLKSMNKMREEPEWYNAVTSNCTTNIRVHAQATAQGAPAPWDWRLLLNGRADEMLYKRGVFAGDLPFAELKQRAHINPAARAADHDPNFSRRIREGRPGF